MQIQKSYTLEIIDSCKQRHSVWSGGKTTELAIYPPECVYADRDFSARISTATIEMETSEFTSLPGFIRYIMPICGSLRITHDGHTSTVLTPFEAHRFDGAQRTVSEGVCIDFNLMLRSGWEGMIKKLIPGEDCSCKPSQMLWVYCLKPLLIQIPDEKDPLKMSKGSVLNIHSCSENINIYISADSVQDEIPAIMAKAWRE